MQGSMASTGRELSASRAQCADMVLELNGLMKDSQSGCLIQMWLPDQGGTGAPVLTTKDLVYSITGLGDMLALFRCMSCRYHFTTDILSPSELGAVGRVYTTLQPEMCCDLQKYEREIYMRVQEAQKCSVHSTMLLPIFKSKLQDSPLGVLEVVKTSKDVCFTELIDKISKALSRVNLRGPQLAPSSLKVGLRCWPLSVDISFDYLRPGESNGSAVNENEEDLQIFPVSHLSPDCRNGNREHSAESCNQEENSLKMTNASETKRETLMLGVDNHEEKAKPQCASTSMPEGEEVLDAEKLNALIGFLAGQNHRKKGQRKTRMGSGKHLTFNQLKGQFGYGLKEAAGRLGICPTTLKRACRRNGIERWPCRQIAKLSKAMKSAGYSEDDSEKLLNSAVSGKMKVDQLLANCSIPAGGRPTDDRKEVCQRPEALPNSNDESLWLPEPMEFGSAPDALDILAGCEDGEGGLDPLKDILDATHNDFGRTIDAPTFHCELNSSNIYQSTNKPEMKDITNVDFGLLVEDAWALGSEIGALGDDAGVLGHDNEGIPVPDIVPQGFEIMDNTPLRVFDPYLGETQCTQVPAMKKDE